MLEIRKIYDAAGIGSDFDRWQRRYRYFVVLHVGAARDLLGHLGHHACNGAVETTRLLRGPSPDRIDSPQLAMTRFEIRAKISNHGLNSA
jgi:hypothetical protein